MTRTASAHGLTSEPAGKWAKQAACRGVDPEVMHPSNDETEIHRAKQVCARCWVARACFWDAVATGDMEHGIRAGLRPNERRDVLKEINRRKTAPVEQAAEQTAAPAETPAAPRPKRKSPEPARCGTNAGHRKHVREKTKICEPCRQAHTKADNQLRRTGTTKVAV